jgi:hypothetical protein
MKLIHGVFVVYFGLRQTGLHFLMVNLERSQLQLQILRLSLVLHEVLPERIKFLIFFRVSLVERNHCALVVIQFAGSLLQLRIETGRFLLVNFEQITGLL